MYMLSRLTLPLAIYITERSSRQNSVVTHTERERERGWGKNKIVLDESYISKEKGIKHFSRCLPCSTGVKSTTVPKSEIGAIACMTPEMIVGTAGIGAGEVAEEIQMVERVVLFRRAGTRERVRGKGSIGSSGWARRRLWEWCAAAPR